MWAIPTGKSLALKKKKKVKSPSIWFRTPNSVRIRQLGRTGNRGVAQVGQLALAMLNQSKDAFLSDTKKNPKDCMVVTLRSGREIESIKEEEKKKTKKEEKEETGKRPS